LKARIGADDQKRVGCFYAFNRRVEYVACAAERWIERSAVLPAVDIGAAEGVHQQLERVHLLDCRKIACNRADPFRRGIANGGLDRRERLTPRRLDETSALAYIGSVEALGSQPVEDETRLVGDPLLVH